MFNNMSPRFTLDQNDVKLILVIISHGLVGIIVMLISEVFLHLNYGAYSPLITLALSTISATLTQWSAATPQSSL
jgi:hypothetical protein